MSSSFKRQESDEFRLPLCSVLCWAVSRQWPLDSRGQVTYYNIHVCWALCFVGPCCPGLQYSGVGSAWAPRVVFSGLILNPELSILPQSTLP